MIVAANVAASMEICRKARWAPNGRATVTAEAKTPASVSLPAAGTLLGPDEVLFVLGSRGAALAQERGRPAAWAHPMATRPEGVPETIRHLTAELYGWIARGDLARVEVMFARHRQGSGATMERSLLFPVDLSSFALRQPRLPPLHNLPPAMLLEKLIADYVFGLLTEAAIEALTSENAARFT